RPHLRHAVQATLRCAAGPRRAREAEGPRARARDRHRRHHAGARARGPRRGGARGGRDRRHSRHAVAGGCPATVPRGAVGRVKITVVGGGVIGCATAYELAKAGCAVTLFERATPGAEASGAAAGLLTPVGDSRGSAYDQLRLESWRLYPALVDELRQRAGIDV